MKFAKIFLITIACSLALGCAHVTPFIEEPRVIAFDGNAQNAGIVREIPNQGGWEVTAHFRDRFNAYAEAVGQKLLPKVPKDFGLSPLGTGTWALTYEGMTTLEKMQLIVKRQKQERATGLLGKVGL